jgi:hypothetical protein
VASAQRKTGVRLSLRFTTFEVREHRLLPDAARAEFFEAIDRIAPKVRASLQSNVWPAYRKTICALTERGEIKNRRHELLYPLEYNPNVPPLPHAPADAFRDWYEQASHDGDVAVRPLQKAIDRWMADYNIRAPWVLQTVMRMLRFWERAPERMEQPIWFTPGIRESHQVPAERVELAVPLPSIDDFLMEVESDIRRRYVEGFGAELERHLKALRTEATSQGIPVAQEKLQDQHYEWLVRYQVLGESADAIAQSVQRDRKTVDEAVKRLAKYLDLPLRSKRPAGRRRGSKTRHRIHH